VTALARASTRRVSQAILAVWVPVPKGLNLVEAAALPMAVETATYSLDLLGLASGQTILVNGGGTMTGFEAVQIALLRGAQRVERPILLCTLRRSLARCPTHHAAKHRTPRDKGDECRSAHHRLALFPTREGATTILASIWNPECRETETLFREVKFFLRCLEYKTWQAQGGLEVVALCINLELLHQGVCPLPGVDKWTNNVQIGFEPPENLLVVVASMIGDSIKILS
jgi:hypothetical protein